jgi:hypothetical protein
MLEKKIPEPRLPTQPATGSEDGSSSAKQVLQFPVQNRFRALWDLGYRHLVPVVPHDAVLSPRSHLAKRKRDVRGKAPGKRGSDGEWYGLKCWQTHVPSASDLAEWQGMGAGVGMRLGQQHDGTFLFAVDADTLDRASAVVIGEAVEARFGRVPVRIGNSPKALYLVRCHDALPYRSLAFEHGVVEILGKDKQCVMAGIHPVTLKPYRIARPASGLPPLETLPLRGASELEGLLADLSAVLPKPERVYGEHGSNDRASVDQDRLKGDLELVRQAVEALPNRYPADGYAWWVKLAAAIRGACQEDDGLGLELFEEFTAKAELGEEAGESAARVYRSINAPFGVGASLLFEWAEERSGGKFDRSTIWFDKVAAVAADQASTLPAEVATAPAASDVFEMLTPGEIVSRPPLRFVVARYLPERSLGFLYGAPGSRKSFITFDIAMTLATGMPDWHGHAIDADPTACVVYIAGEGAHGMQPRMLAWAKRHGLSEADLAASRFRLLPVSVNLMQPEQVRKLARTIRLGVGRASLVVVDTVSRAIPGVDENLQAPMSLFVQQCDAIKDEFGCVVLGVHHANQRGGVRGSGVLAGAGDFVFKLSKEKGAPAGLLSCEKMKDGPDGWEEPFRFDVVEVEGGSSLVPSRCIVSVGPDASGAPDTEARAQAALQAAWDAGAPWCAGPQGGERYAVLRLISDFGFSREAAKAALRTWTLTGRIKRSVFNKSTKAEGYHLTYTLPETEAETPGSGLFS